MSSWNLIDGKMLILMQAKNSSGFCHSPVDIRASARAGVSGSEREGVRIGAEVSAIIDRRMTNTTVS